MPPDEMAAARGRELEVTKAPPWHGWVAADFFLSSLAGGVFAVAALCHLVEPVEFGPPARMAYVAAFVLVLADLASLIADLGDPARFHHMLRTFKPGSPMSLGVWITSAFAVIAFCACVLALLVPANFDAALRTVAAVGIAPALAMGAYKGVLLSATAQPAWRELRWLGAAFAASSGALGVALMLAMTSVTGRLWAASRLREALVPVLVLAGVGVAAVGVEAHGALRERLGARGLARFYVLVLVTGVLLPLLLAFRFHRAPTDALIALLVVAGAIAFRHYIVVLPHRSAR